MPKEYPVHLQQYCTGIQKQLFNQTHQMVPDAVIGRSTYFRIVRQHSATPCALGGKQIWPHCGWPAIQQNTPEET